MNPGNLYRGQQMLWSVWTNVKADCTMRFISFDNIYETKDWPIFALFYVQCFDYVFVVEKFPINENKKKAIRFSHTNMTLNYSFYVKQYFEKVSHSKKQYIHVNEKMIKAYCWSIGYLIFAFKLESLRFRYCRYFSFLSFQDIRVFDCIQALEEIYCIGSRAHTLSCKVSLNCWYCGSDFYL